MFEDDRGRLLLIQEWLGCLNEELTSGHRLTEGLIWWRLSRIEGCFAKLTPAYRQRHPQIAALNLPSVDRVHDDPAPPIAFTRRLAQETISAFEPLLADLPPPPAPRPLKPNPNSRFNEIVSKLQKMEPGLRAQGLSALYLFGSVSRREDELHSDVDLAFVVDQEWDGKFTLFDQSRLGEELREALSSAVDFVELDGFREDVRERIGQDLVRVFGDVGT